MTAYVPDQGDLVWLNFAPQTGREQAGRRPGLVLSPKSYNRLVGLAIIAPLTSKIKGYPFEVPLPDGHPVQGVVLADHLKSLDWRARQVEYAGRVEAPILEEAFQKVLCLLKPAGS